MSEDNKKSLYKERQKTEKVRQYTPSVSPPIEGQITSTVNRVTLDFLKEIDNFETNLEEYIRMARNDSVVRSCIELKCLRAALLIGKYNHPDEQIQEWVRSNISGMITDFIQVVGRMSSAMALGFSTAEIVFSNKVTGFPGEWRLKKINVLDQTRVTFDGQAGELKEVIYQEGDGRKLAIPYEKCFHIVHGFASNVGCFDEVYGDPESATAYKYYIAKKALLTELMIAAKQMAGGIVVGKADSNQSVQKLNLDGSVYNGVGGSVVENAVTSLARALQNLENNNVVVTDKNNEISTLSHPTAEAFWQATLNFMNEQIMRAYSVPKLLFDEGSGSFGVNSLGKQQKTMLDAQIESVVNQIRKQFIDKVVKPLLVWNFGVTKDFGEFQIDGVLDTETVTARLQNIISATSNNIIPNTSIHVRNITADLLGLPEASEREKFEEEQSKLLYSYFETLTFQGQPPLMYKNILEEQNQQEESSASGGAEEPSEETES